MLCTAQGASCCGTYGGNRDTTHIQSVSSKGFLYRSPESVRVHVIQTPTTPHCPVFCLTRELRPLDSLEKMQWDKPPHLLLWFYYEISPSGLGV